MTFYNAKAFMLGEILDGPKSNIFSPTAREILLQYFSAIGALLAKIETSYIACHDGHVSKEAQDFIVRELDTTFKHLDQILLAHPQDFDRTFALLWVKVSERFRTEIEATLANLLVGHISTSFSQIVDFLLQFLNHVMFMLHEVTCLILRDPPLLYVSQLDVTVQQHRNFNLPLSRITSYEEDGFLSAGSEVYVLREVSDTFIRQHSTHITALESITDQLQRYNIKLS